MRNKADEEEISDYEDELKSVKPEDKKKKLKKCFYCNKIYDKRKMERFRCNYRCMECAEANVERRVLYKDQVCNYCDKKFVMAYNMKRAPNEPKVRPGYVRCDECKLLKITRGPQPGPPFTYGECDLCGMTFTKKKLLYNHMDHHRSDVCCRVCGAKFTARTALRAHLRTHFEKFICELCGFTTNIQPKFRLHNRIHSGEIGLKSKVKKEIPKGEYPCSICGLVYETRSGLYSHEKRRHSNKTGENGFICKICEHVSRCFSDFRVHVLTHSTRPLLFCQFPGCNIYYDRVKYLNRHIKNVHNNNSTYTCETCSKTFKYKSSLGKHLRNKGCIPVKNRNLGKDSISKKMKEMNCESPEELERIARIAKQQYLEVRGSSKVFEKEEISESEEAIFDNKIEQKILKETIHIDEDSIDYHDCLDDSQHNDEIKDVIKIEKDGFNDIKDIPFLNVEIKTEPDIESSIHSVVHDHWSFLHNDIVKADPDHDNATLNLPNPFVLLERIDYNTISKWLKIKAEDQPVPGKINKTKEIKKCLDYNYCPLRRSYGRKAMTYICDLCGFKTKLKNNIKFHLTQHKERKTRHQCKYCPEAFSAYINLKAHMKIIHKMDKNNLPKDYICDLCGKGFTDRPNLRDHFKCCHSSDRFQCHLCKLVFKLKVNLFRHIQDVHEQLYKYPCSYCGKFFKRKQSLKSHELRHVTPKEKCEICGKMVKLIKEHIRIVHSKNKKNIELSPCPECGKSYPKYQLNPHIDRAHRKLMYEGIKIRHCIKCDQTFTRFDDLRRHDILEHYEGVVKRCPYDCDAVFKRTKTLNLHIKNTHVKGNSYSCEVCGRAYNTKSGLLKHRKVKNHNINAIQNEIF